MQNCLNHEIGMGYRWLIIIIAKEKGGTQFLRQQQIALSEQL